MEYLKKALDITSDIIFTSYPWFVIGVAVIAGFLDFISANANNTIDATRIINSFKVSLISAAFMIALTFIFYAPYRIWLDERKMLGDAKTQLDNANTKLAIKERNANIRLALDKFRMEALLIQQHYRGVYLSQMRPGQTVDDEFLAWHKNVREYLSANFPAHIAHFEDIMVGAPIILPSGVPADKMNTWGILERYKQKLEELWKEHFDPHDATKS